MHVTAKRSLLTAALLLLFMVVPAWAQNGAIAGRVTAAEGSMALAAALVEAETASGAVAASAVTDSDGRFRLSGLPPGAYTVEVTAVGFASVRQPVTVTAGATATVNAVLNAQAFDLNPVVVSASRQSEKAVDAPAHVEVIGERDLDMRPTVSPADHLRGTVGVDIVTQGIQSTNVVLRGFNNIFSGSLHALTDNRIAGVPSLRVNVLHFIPSNNDDLERMEVVLGPGAALYGPNTAGGVLHMITKSPLADPGTTFSIAGGEKSFFEVAGRSAHRLSDNFGVKLSGLYLQASEWEYTDPTEQAEIAKFASSPVFRADLMRSAGISQAEADRRIALIGGRDNDVQRWSLEGRADWKPTEEVNTIFSAGTTRQGSGIELTGLGAGQAIDWMYSYFQARTNWKRLFAQAYVNASDAGETYLLRNGAPIQDQSKLYVAQVQHGFRFGTQHNFTYGLDYLFTNPETNGTINGIYEDEDETTEIGGYLQYELALTPKFDVVLAGRVDDHSALPDPIFSPRAGIVFKPAENQAFRLTFNQAFSTPSSLNQFLDLGSAFPAGNPTFQQLALLGYSLRVQGTGQQGFTFRQADGSYLMRSPFMRDAQGNPAPAALVPTNAALFYRGAVEAAAQGAAAAGRPIPDGVLNYLRTLQPTSAQIGTFYRHPSIATATGDISGLQLDAIDPIRESTTTTYEAGYRGVVGGKLLMAVDGWWERRENLVTPLTTVTPLVFLNGTQTGAYLVPQLMAIGVPQADAVAIATAIASVPVGVISSADVNANGAQLLTTYYNVDDDVDYFGADFTATYLLSDMFSIGGTLSLVNDNVFETSQGEAITLNAPKTKGSITGAYRSIERGIDTELRVRFNDEFPVRSGVYNGTECIGGNEPGREACVEGATLVDLTASYRLPQFNAATIQLGATNIFDKEYRSFPGVPNVGRLVILRLKYDL